eukprot:PhF_6_TR19709/c0_g1_i1/m.28777/K10743/RNASEH2A; ribonuclease H2 subunit A
MVTKKAAEGGGKRKRVEREVSDLESYDLPALMAKYNWSENDYIVGVDEAGRGPAIGPMVYAAFGCRLGDHPALKSVGVQDSKALTEKLRDEMFPHLTALENAPKFQYAVDVIGSDRISAAMSSRDKMQTLNTVSHNSAIDMIKQICEKVNVVAAYVDTVGPADKYRDKIKKFIPQIQVVVTPKADARFAVVSAASIIAKVTRDKRVREISGAVGGNVGSGYPSDPNTQKWLAGNMHTFFGFQENQVRMRWGTVEKLVEKHCVSVVFSTDDDADVISPQQTTLKDVTPEHSVLSQHLRVMHVRGKRTRDD